MIDQKIIKLFRSGGLGEAEYPITPVAGGFLHSMYKVNAAGKTYAVKHLNPEVMGRPTAASNFAAAEKLEAVLEDAGIPIVPALLLARQSGETVGFAQCQLRHDYVEGTSTCPVGYLEGIYVEPSHRHQGVAAALLHACVTWAKRKGCTEFASDCELENADSLRFHQRLGFREANRIICFTKALK